MNFVDLVIFKYGLKYHGFMARIIPSKNEVERWVKEAVLHSNNVEYYLNNLGVGGNDPERPHDLVGKNNKLDWKVVSGLALSYRDPQVDFEKYVLPSIELHRNQYHHRMWNKYNSEADDDALLVGAVDATCSLLEKRTYVGGKKQEELGKRHDWENIEKLLLEKNPKYKVGAASLIIPSMREIPSPKLWRIRDVFDFPNIGIRDDIYLKMRDRIDEAIGDLRKHVDIF